MGEIADTRDSLVNDDRRSSITPSGVSRVVGVLRTVYGLAVILGVGATVSLLATKGSAHYPIAKWACLALALEGYSLTYLGLRLRKAWVVPLIGLESAYAVVPWLSEQPETLAAVVMVRVFSALTLFQLWFFTRPATRRFFGTDGMVVL
jgi:hypothetical protein